MPVTRYSQRGLNRHNPIERPPAPPDPPPDPPDLPDQPPDPPRRRGRPPGSRNRGRGSRRNPIVIPPGQVKKLKIFGVKSFLKVS